MRYILSLFFILLAACSSQQHPATKTAFSPDPAARKLVIETIDSATKEIRVAAYYFTDVGIMNRLANRRLHGVSVKVKVDANTPARDKLSKLVCLGVDVELVSQFRIHHNKYIVADDTVQTGSYNYTHSAATANSENVVVVTDPSVANDYRRHFDSVHGSKLLCSY